MRGSGGQPERDYPEDEFDTDFTPGSRRGAHRTAGGLAEGLPWILAALLTVVVIVGVLALVTRPDSTIPVADGAGSTSTSTTAAPDDPASSSPQTSTQPPASTTPTTSTTSSEPTPSATIDQAEPLTVLNGTFTAGLAGEVAAALGEQGWTVASVDNFPQRPQAFTSVFYYTDEDAATAQAVAEDVGGPAVRQAADEGPVTVVIGDNYEP